MCKRARAPVRPRFFDLRHVTILRSSVIFGYLLRIPDELNLETPQALIWKCKMRPDLGPELVGEGKRCAEERGEDGEVEQTTKDEGGRRMDGWVYGRARQGGRKIWWSQTLGISPSFLPPFLPSLRRCSILEILLLWMRRE